MRFCAFFNRLLQLKRKATEPALRWKFWTPVNQTLVFSTFGARTTPRLAVTVLMNHSFLLRWKRGCALQDGSGCGLSDSSAGIYSSCVPWAGAVCGEAVNDWTGSAGLLSGCVWAPVDLWTCHLSAQKHQAGTLKSSVFSLNLALFKVLNVKQ